MTGPTAAPPEKAIIVLGCPEVPVQQALALYIASGLRDRGADVLVTGNPSGARPPESLGPEKRLYRKDARAGDVYRGNR